MKIILASDNYYNLSNGLFHNEANHIFLQTVLKLFDSTYINGKYSSSGAMVFTRAMQELCSQPIANLLKYNSNNVYWNCSGMTIAETSIFYPYDWTHHVELGEKKSKLYWEEKFRKCLAVTYYQASSMFTPTRSSTFVLHPKKYGAEKPALAYLGPKQCPISFYSVSRF